MKDSRRRVWVAALWLLATLALPGAPASARAQPHQTVRLTDGRSFAHWAHPQHNTPIRRRPQAGSPAVARTHYLTEDGLPEVYPVLQKHTHPDGRSWLQIRVPMRPNGHTGWVPATALGPLQRVPTRLLVDRRSQRATLYHSGWKIWSSPIGIGAPTTPTPPGHYWIREKIKVTNPNGPYGPWAFGTSAYSVLSDWPGGGVIGIHGTNQPQLIPGTPSHGCIRLPNPAITQLTKHMPIGTPIHIR